MRRFAAEYPDFEFVQSVTAQIPWTHNILLIEKIKDIKIRKWYIDETIKNGWSVNILEMQLTNKLYERQAINKKVTNFGNTLPIFNINGTILLCYIKGEVEMKKRCKFNNVNYYGNSS